MELSEITWSDIKEKRCTPNQAKELIKSAIACNIIMHPNDVRMLYEAAEIDVPQHLLPLNLTYEEQEKLNEIGRNLFK